MAASPSDQPADPASHTASVRQTGRRAALWLGQHPLRWLAAIGSTTLCLLLLLAWLVPPLLDWGRFRASFAAVAAAQLGRPVSISGDLTLRLLPETILTASSVTLSAPAAAPDGVSAQLGSLRLQLAFWPLLRGHIMLRDLVLGTPIITLPWPPAQAALPHLPRGFSAHIENATLHAGSLTLSHVTAAIHAGPDSGDLQATAFGAEGFATLAGHDWRFTTALGAPDADGVSALDLSMSMMHGGALPTGLNLQATLTSGALQGRVHGQGADLSRLLPGPAQPWVLDAPFTATRDQLESALLRLTAGSLTAQGTFQLALQPNPSLTATLSVPSLDMAAWSGLMRGAGPAGPLTSTLPLRINLAADQALLFGGTLTGLHTTLVSNGAALTLESTQTTLPGGGHLALGTAQLLRTQGSLALQGPATLTTPDVAATLAWLNGFAPAFVASLPAVPSELAAHLQGQLHLATDQISLATLAGTIGTTTLSGGFGLSGGVHEGFGFGLTLNQLDLDAWLPAIPPTPADLGRKFVSLPAGLHLQAATAHWHGIAFTDFQLDARASATGLQLDHLAAKLGSAAFTLSGSLAPDGVLSQAHATARVAELASTEKWVPAAWAIPPGLLRGPGFLEVKADGPISDLAFLGRAEAGDLLVEAEAHTNLPKAQSTITLTARHPGAPRLLAALGAPGTEPWLGTGSMALLAHLQTSPGHVMIEDFALNAAALRLAGDLTLQTTPQISLAGHLQAANLALPTLSDALSPAALATLTHLARPGLDAHLQLTAAQTEFGQQPGPTALKADLVAEATTLRADALTATLAGGHLEASARIMGPQATLVGTLTGAQAAAEPHLLPTSVVGGTYDLGVQLSSTPPEGALQLTLHNATLSGFDMAALRHAATLPPAKRRAARSAALASGQTPALNGALSGAITNGKLTLTPAKLTSPEGTLTLTGTANLPAQTTDLTLTLNAPPATHLHLK